MFRIYRHGGVLGLDGVAVVLAEEHVANLPRARERERVRERESAEERAPRLGSSSTVFGVRE